MTTPKMITGTASERVRPEFLEVATAKIRTYEEGLREALLIVRHDSNDARSILAHRIAALEFLGGVTEGAMKTYRINAGETADDAATRQQFQYDLSIAHSRVSNRVQDAIQAEYERRKKLGA